MSSNKGKSASARLRQDYLRLKKEPVPYVDAEPLPSNILEWHYVVKGPESTLYEGGYYHGKLVFPNDFPFKPPSIFMITPSGRFRTNSRLCLSISDFHPDTWNPVWSVSTILAGILSFMIDWEITVGSIETTDYDKRQYAFKSLEFNLRDTLFCELFPDIVTEMQKEIDKRVAIHESTGIQNPGQQEQEREQEESSRLQRNLTNLIVFLGFIAYYFYCKFFGENIPCEYDY